MNNNYVVDTDKYNNYIIRSTRPNEYECLSWDEAVVLLKNLHKKRKGIWQAYN